MNAGADSDGVVLVIDDDEGIRETLELALQHGHHRVALASDGIEALAWLRDHRPPCLILLDLMMPRMNGWQVLEELRRDQRLAGVPVVVITAFGRGLEGAPEVPILNKPIELDGLLRLVGAHCRAGA